MSGLIPIGRAIRTFLEKSPVPQFARNSRGRFSFFSEIALWKTTSGRAAPTGGMP
jgi:hypothetical protein